MYVTLFMTERWTQLLKKGTLTKWAKMNANRIKRVTGENAFTKNGDLNDRALRILLKKHEQGKIKLSDSTVRKIRAKFTLNKLSKRRS